VLHPAVRGGPVGIASSGPSAVAVRHPPWKAKTERAPLTGHARDRDLAAQKPGQPSADAEPEPYAFGTLMAHRARLPEGLEEVRKVRARATTPRVADV